MERSLQYALLLTVERSLRWDRGTEFAQHVRFTLAPNAKEYFYDLTPTASLVSTSQKSPAKR